MQAVIDATGQKDDIVQRCFILQGVVDGVSTCHPPQEMRLRVIKGGAGTGDQPPRSSSRVMAMIGLW
jgi:hypothetical protein